jgi:hypothetical protein
MIQTVRSGDIEYQLEIGNEKGHRLAFTGFLIAFALYCIFIPVALFGDPSAGWFDAGMARLGLARRI